MGHIPRITELWPISYQPRLSFALALLEEISMNECLLGHISALYGYTGPGTTWDNEMHLSINHAPGTCTGSITRPVDLQSCVLPLHLGCAQNKIAYPPF